MYYKASWIGGETDSNWYFIDAESSEEALKKTIETLEEDKMPFEKDSLKIEPITTVELIDDIAQSAKAQMLRLYIGLHFENGDLTVREYANLNKKMETDDETRLQVYRDVQRYHRRWRLIKKFCDTDKMTGTEMINAVNQLWRINEGEEFQQYLESLPQKKK